MSLATNTLKADWSDLKEHTLLTKVHVFYYFLYWLLGKEGWWLLFWSTLNFKHLIFRLFILHNVHKQV